MIKRTLPGGQEYFEMEPGEVPPPHDVEACGECTFVSHGSNIFYTKAQETMATVDLPKMLAITARIRDAEDYIVSLGKFSLPRWVGHAVWYLFQCPDCHIISRDYLHGHRLYLVCGECDYRWHVSQARFYEETGMPRPKSAWQQFLALRRIRKAYKDQAAVVPVTLKPRDQAFLAALKGEPPPSVKRSDESRHDGY